GRAPRCHAHHPALRPPDTSRRARPDVRVVRTVAELRQAVAAERTAGRRIAMVPTMGAFHAGHLALMDRAGADDHSVVVTLFVNTTQFAAGEDLSSYPRDKTADASAARRHGVRILFAPAVDEMYPPGFATTVAVAGPSEGLEGASRPTHFDGVAT